MADSTSLSRGSVSISLGVYSKFGPKLFSWPSGLPKSDVLYSFHLSFFTFFICLKISFDSLFSLSSLVLLHSCASQFTMSLLTLLFISLFSAEYFSRSPAFELDFSFLLNLSLPDLCRAEVLFFFLFFSFPSFSSEILVSVIFLCLSRFHQDMSHFHPKFQVTLRNGYLFLY